MAGRFNTGSGRYGQPRRPLTVLVSGAIAALIVFALLGIRTSGADQTEDIHHLVETLSRETASTTDNFLRPAVVSSNVLADWLANSPAGALADPIRVGPADVDNMLLSTLVQNQSFDGVFVGYPTGAFQYASRSDSQDPGGFRLKSITVTAGAGTETSLTWFDANRQITLVEVLPDDTYDPRTRSWYEGALESPTGGWTEPYAFFTSGLPGVTRFQSVRDEAGDPIAVVGTDLRIAELSAFVRERTPSEHGLTFILGNNDTVMAHPDLEQLTSGNKGLRLVSEFSDPRVVAARELQSRAPARATTSPSTGITGANSASVTNVTLDGAPVTFAITQLTVAPAWDLIMTAPESDFLAATRSTRADLGRLALAVAVCLTASLIWMTRTTIRDLRRDAASDPLTGLANRTRAMALMEALREGGTRFSVAIIDLDQFKVINDTHGHGVGDHILKRVARQLEIAAGDGLACRLGGDEFLIILPDHDAHRALSIARATAASLARTIKIDDTAITATVSIGVATVPAHANPASIVTTLRNADIALYMAKHSGRNRAVLFDENLRILTDRENARRQELRTALSRQDVSVVFHREVDLHSGEVTGAVASARWVRSNGTAVPGPELAADAAALGMLPELATIIIRETRTLAESWLQMNPGRPLRVHLRVRLPELIDSRFEASIERSGLLNCSHLVVDVGERDLQTLTDAQLAQLNRLRSLGVQIAVDDFGITTVPITRMRTLPMDLLKADPVVLDGLITEKSADVLASFILSFGTSLELEVAAKSITSNEEAEALADIGYRIGLGPLFGADLTRDEFLREPSLAPTG